MQQTAAVVRSRCTNRLTYFYSCTQSSTVLDLGAGDKPAGIHKVVNNTTLVLCLLGKWEVAYMSKFIKKILS